MLENKWNEAGDLNKRQTEAGGVAIHHHILADSDCQRIPPSKSD